MCYDAPKAPNREGKMRVYNFKTWFTYNKMLLNVTVLGYHVHIHMWGLGVMKASPKHYYHFRLWRICNVIIHAGRK